VKIQGLDPRYARILGTGRAGAALPSGVGSQHDAFALHADGDTVGQHDPGQSDPRDVARGNQSGQQVERTVGRVSARRIQHSLDLEVVAGSEVMMTPRRVSSYGTKTSVGKRLALHSAG